MNGTALRMEKHVHSAQPDWACPVPSVPMSIFLELAPASFKINETADYKEANQHSQSFKMRNKNALLLAARASGRYSYCSPQPVQKGISSAKNAATLGK